MRTNRWSSAGLGLVLVMGWAGAAHGQGPGQPAPPTTQEWVLRRQQIRWQSQQDQMAVVQGVTANRQHAADVGALAFDQYVRGVTVLYDTWTGRFYEAQTRDLDLIFSIPGNQQRWRVVPPSLLVRP